MAISPPRSGLPPEFVDRAINPSKHETPTLAPEEWVDRHGDAMFRYAMVRLGDRSAAEEAVQSALLAALQSRDAFSGRSSERTWLIGVLRHKVLDQIRIAARTTRNACGDDRASADGRPPEDHADRRGHSHEHGSAQESNMSVFPTTPAELSEAREILRLCLERLPLLHRQVLVLREVDDLSTDVICSLLDLSATNLWTVIHRAKLTLREAFERAWLGRDASKESR